MIIRLLLPILEVLAPLHTRLRLKGYRKAMNRKFRRAGGFNDMTVDMFLAFKEVCFLITSVLCFVYLGSRTTSLMIGLSIVAGLAGSFIPEIMLSMTIAKRGQQILRELPYILDLLTLSVEAGLDFMRAIERVVRTIKKGELVKELAIAHKSLEMGYSREGVLRQLDSRTEMSEVKTVVSALVQADRLGTGIGNALRAVAAQAREARSQRAESLAGKATVKLLIPLVLVFGAVMLMVLGPVGIQIWMTLRQTQM